MAATERRTAAANSGRRPGKRLRRSERIFRLAGAQEIQVACAGISEPLPRLREMPGMRRHAVASGSESGARGGQNDYRYLQIHGERSAGIFQGTATQRSASQGRGQNPGRNSVAAAISGRGWIGLFVVGSIDFNAFRRRVATHTTGDFAWFSSGR